jgi:chromosome segregation ATPase
MQVDAQKAETRAATETLVEAEQEMDAIHFEKRQLTAQWRSSLLAITRREEALAAIKAAIHEQEEQERSIANELARFKKDIQEQQARISHCASVCDILETHAVALCRPSVADGDDTHVCARLNISTAAKSGGVGAARVADRHHGAPRE